MTRIAKPGGGYLTVDYDKEETNEDTGSLRGEPGGDDRA